MPVSSRADTLLSVASRRGPYGAMDAPTDQGGDVLGRLEPAIVGQHDQMPGRDARVGGEQQRDADIPGL